MFVMRIWGMFFGRPGAERIKILYELGVAEARGVSRGWTVGAGLG